MAVKKNRNMEHCGTRETKIFISVFVLYNVIKITTTATQFWPIRTLVRKPAPSEAVYGKEHAIGLCDTSIQRYDIL